MLKIKHIPSLVLLSLLWSCSEKTEFPQPTEVKKDAEEGEQGKLRQKWFELMHGGPHSGWQSQEIKNQEDRLAYVGRLEGADRDGVEDLAEGRIRGTWIERGSTNQAGSIVNVWYDQNNDWLYAIGAGGPIFRGGLSGFSWELVNDDLRFDGNVLEAFEMQDGIRLMAFSGGIPYFSEDEGKVWQKASGFAQAADGYHIHSCVRLQNESLVLAKKGWSNNYILYKTEDGKKYSIVKVFTTSDGRNLAMCAVSDKNALMLIEQLNAELTKIYTLPGGGNELRALTADSPLGFGTEGRANIQCHVASGDTTLFVFNSELKFHKSTDQGQSWQVIGILPSSPWDMAVMVPPSNPQKPLYGEVNAYRSGNGGKNWNVVNEWWEYYGQVQTKLHADMMVMKEFKDQNNKDVIIIGHHGGISVTYDYGVNTKNISMFGLHVSQYYDVRSYPSDPLWMFAGAQDQGLQRGYAIDQNVADFYQNISGDYGHIEFTANGKHMWTMYPGGSLSFYLNPTTQNNPTVGYEINSKRESVWIPPIAVDPHSNKDIIYVAGGSVDANSSGSHILKIEYVNNEISASELPFNFAVSGGEISAIAISPFDPNIWFVSTTNGYVYKSVDGGIQFTLKQKMTAGAHYLYGSCILPSSIDPNIIYLSGSGYGSVAPVYVSRNGGNSFEAMRNGMPSTMAFQIAANEDENLIYAATETGPYVYLANENKWYPLSGTTTPNQTYWSVEYLPSLKTARFATYGRGVWDFEFESLPTAVQDVDTKDGEIVLWPLPVVGEINWKLPVEADRITLFQASGIPVKEINPGADNADMTGLPAGVYYLRFNFGKKQKVKTIFKI